jgi:hypothetical protein
MTRAVSMPDTVTLHVPFRIVKRGGRKEMQLPEGAAQSRRTDNTLVKALARAFRWKRMLESGEFATIAELAQHEGIAPSYMTRVLRLTLLAPDIVEAILDGKQGPEVTLARILEPFPASFAEQRGFFSGRCPPTRRLHSSAPKIRTPVARPSRQAADHCEPPRHCDLQLVQGCHQTGYEKKANVDAKLRLSDPMMPAGVALLFASQ